MSSRLSRDPRRTTWNRKRSAETRTAVASCLTLILLAVADRSSGGSGTAAALAAPVPIAEPSAQGFAPVFGLDEFVPVPDDNPLTPEKIALGAQLFADPLLSIDSTRSCASCHRPSHAFSDTVRYSRGVLGRDAIRHTPSLLNRAYGRSFFWDGRAGSLEVAVLLPIENPNELALPLESLLSRLRQHAPYREAFRGAFSVDSITVTAVSRALASYVRSLRVGGYAIDRYEAGDTTALTAPERRGRSLFNGKGRCTFCHLGPTLSDEDFHNTGIAWGTDDRGRELVTGDPRDRGRFKTPSLRDLARTGPYMHDGSKATIEDVVDFYSGGGQANSNLDPDIEPRHFSPDEKRDLVHFLRALSRR